jgi:allantoinase
VHFCDPGRTDRETFTTGTRAPIAGRITTVVEMPVTDPMPTTVEALKVKRDAVRSKSLIDFGLSGAVGPDTAKHLDGFREAGVALFKNGDRAVAHDRRDAHSHE